MTFGSTFGRTFSPTFKPNSLSPAVASFWWLAGGIAAANCVAAYQAKGAASYAASKVNLANPGTYNAADGAAYPTWDVVNGLKFLGTNLQYLSTGLVVTTSYSYIIRFSNAASGATTMFGSYNSGNTFAHRLQPNRDNAVRYGLTTAVAPGMSSGVLAIAGTTGYRDGSSDATNIAVGNSTKTAYIGAQQNALNAAEAFWTGYVQAFAIYNATLSSTQVGLLSTAMAAL